MAQSEAKITDLPEYTIPISGNEYIEIASNDKSYKLLMSSILSSISFKTYVDKDPSESGLFILDFSDNSNYTITLTSNRTVSVTNPITGEVRVINAKGAFNLIIPSSHKKMAGWDEVTPTANSVISYTVVYDGTDYIWNKMAYV